MRDRVFNASPWWNAPLHPLRMPPVAAPLSPLSKRLCFRLSAQSCAGADTPAGLCKLLGLATSPSSRSRLLRSYCGHGRVCARIGLMAYSRRPRRT